MKQANPMNREHFEELLGKTISIIAGSRTYRKIAKMRNQKKQNTKTGRKAWYDK